jgi:hypothetical protein
MKLRRLKMTALAIVALMAMDASNFWPMDDLTHGQARAQIPIIANGLVNATIASVNAANTTTETLLYQYPIPAALIASWTALNNAFGAPPLHLRLNGLMRTAGGTGLGGNNAPATLGVNLGGSAATMTILNGLTLPSDLGSGTSCGSGAAMGVGACYAPVAIDVLFSPIATVTTQNCTDLRPCSYSVYMSGRFMTASIAANNNSLATELTVNTATLGTVNVLTSQTLNVLWRWGSAASVNTLNIYNGSLTIGW